MIVSASRRTDIPACHFRWFLNRMEAGFALVQNPRNPRRLSKIPLRKGTTDCIAFWSKNPAPLLQELPALQSYGIPFYLQYTLTPYGPLLEPGLPEKGVLLHNFIALAEKLGPERMVWRYDPILIGEGLSVEDHLRLFGQMAKALKGRTHRCILSFLDVYPRIRKALSGVARAPSGEECLLLAKGLSQIAGEADIKLFTCSEEIELDAYGIGHAACIDKAFVEQIVGAPIKAKKDPGQRPICGCIESADIGAYDTCPLGCIYCYGTRSRRTAAERLKECDPQSPMLWGWPGLDQVITERDWKSLIDRQMTLG